MSKRLRDIPTSCPMFDKAIAELRLIEGLVDEDVWRSIKNEIACAIDYIEEGRTVNGDLRDTCVDIADTLKQEINDTTYHYQQEIESLKADIGILEDRIEELLSNIN